MFIGREKELGILEKLYASESGCACAIYGRRRVGKTFLADRFCMDKKCIRIPFIEGSESMNVMIMLSEIERFTGSPAPVVGSFIDALKLVSEIIVRDRVVVFFDELPYLVRTAPHVPSVLQHFIDHELKESRSLLLVCGSSVSMMKEMIEDMDRPLYGRFMNRIHLRPLSYRECEAFHPDMSRLDALKVYMTVGGYPAYHERMSQDTYRKCIVEGFLGPDAFLVEEEGAMVSRELAHHSLMESILGDIARGTVIIKEISEKEGISITMCGRHLADLNKVGMVSPVVPMANTDQKTKIFRVSDALVEFCHKVILRNYGIASAPDRDKAYSVLEHQIDTFLGHRFEDVCMEYMHSEYLCRKIGKWWGWTGSEIAEIDIVADTTDGENDVCYIGECKFTRRPVGVQVLKGLEERASLVKGYNNRRMILFSAAGFTEELYEIVEKRMDVVLVDLDGLFAHP